MSKKPKAQEKFDPQPTQMELDLAQNFREKVHRLLDDFFDTAVTGGIPRRRAMIIALVTLVDITFHGLCSLKFDREVVEKSLMYRYRNIYKQWVDQG